MRHRFEFQIFARATRVERGTDQLSNVSARLCAVICFAPPSPFAFPSTLPPIYDIQRILFMAAPTTYRN